LARAIVTAIAQIHKHDKDYQWNSIRHGDRFRSTVQKTQAENLMKTAGLSLHDGMCGYLELQKMQAVLPDYRIKVYTKEKYGGLLYDGNE